MSTRRKDISKDTKKSGIRIMPFFVIALASVCFLSVISYNILLGSYYDIRSQYISVVNEQVIEEIETSINFGKTLSNYYGMDKILEKATAQLGEGYDIAILNTDGTVRYSTYGDAGKSFDITEKDKKIIKQDIADESGKTIGTFVTIYEKSAERSLVSGELKHLKNLTSLAALIVTVLTMVVLLLIEKTLRKPVAPIVATIIVAMVVQSVFLIYIYQGTYKETVMKNAEGIGNYIAVSLKEIESKGVSIDKIDGLQDYFNEKTAYGMIAGIQLQGEGSAADTAKSSGDETLMIKLDGHQNDNLQIKVQISGEFIRQMIIGMVLNFIAVIAIIFVITAESMRLPQMLDFKKSRQFNSGNPLQYKQMAYILRYGNFITSVGSYACLAFSALMIRQWNQGAFGLSVGLTAALSISICSLAEVVGLLAAPMFAKKIETKKLLAISTALLIISNLACFMAESSAMVLLLRALSGFGFAGNKQAMNNIIALGYGTSKEREDNLAESNAGLIGGIMCGSSMGAIIAATLGYEATFALAAAVFLLFIMFLIYFIPWKLLAENSKMREIGEVDFKRVFALMKHPQIIRYSLTVNLPIYIYLMVIVVLIPGIIQSNGISPVVLTYCNLFNGLAGLYIGVHLGGALRNKLGIRASITLISIVGTAAIMMQSLPYTVIALLVAAALLGLVDGAGVPLTSDYFLELDSIRGKIDEGTALSLLSIIGFIVMTIAPVLLEACMNSKVAVIVLAIVLFTLSLFIFSKKEKTNENGF